MCADPEIWTAMKTAPEGANSIEWPIEQTRAAEAAARIFWPLGNTRIEKRLGLIPPRAVVVGRERPDHAARLRGHFRPWHRRRDNHKIIPGAGHLAELDKPAEVAKAILDFTA
jgi:pimeloyl-ACP methyl ester carboxylesterase